MKLFISSKTIFSNNRNRHLVLLLLKSLFQSLNLSFIINHRKLKSTSDPIPRADGSRSAAMTHGISIMPTPTRSIMSPLSNATTKYSKVS